MDEIECSTCGKMFCNRYSKKRHEDTFHSNSGRKSLVSEEKKDVESSDGTEDQEIDTSDESNQSSMESEQETEPDAMEEAILETIKDYGMPEYDDDEDELGEVALSKFVDHLKSTVEDELDHARAIKRSQVYKMINDTAKSLQAKHGFSQDEAKCYAWHKRRFLLRNVIHDVINTLGDDEDEDEPSTSTS